MCSSDLGHEHVKDALLHAHRGDTLFKVGLHSILIARIGLNNIPSAFVMLDDLAAVSCTNAGGSWWLFDHRTELTDELFALIGRESPTKWMRTSDIKSLLNKSIQPVVEIPREAP